MNTRELSNQSELHTKPVGAPPQQPWDFWTRGPCPEIHLENEFVCHSGLVEAATAAQEIGGVQCHQQPETTSKPSQLPIQNEQHFKKLSIPFATSNKGPISGRYSKVTSDSARWHLCVMHLWRQRSSSLVVIWQSAPWEIQRFLEDVMASLL